MNPRKIREAIVRLSRLAGQGSAEEWQSDLGPDLTRALQALGPYAEAVVDRIMDGDTYRPTPARLREVGAEVEAEQSRQQDRAGCLDCGGTGWRGARSLRRIGGRLVEREVSVACSCPRGYAYLRTPGVVSVGDLLTSMRTAHMVTRASGEDGLLGWGVIDRHWTAWSPSLYADEDAARRRQEAAQRKLAAYLSGARKPDWMETMEEWG